MEQIKESRRKGRIRRGNRLQQLCRYVLGAGAGFVLAGCNAGGQALPLGAVLVGAQPLGGCAAGTTIGAVAGYFLRCDPAEAVEYSSLTVLMLLTLLLFQGTGLTIRKWFMPLCCGAVYGILGAVRMVGSVDVTPTMWMTRVILSAVGVYCFRKALGGDKRGRILLAGAMVLGIAGVDRYIDIGLGCAVLIACVSRELFPATVMGVTLELSGKMPEHMALTMVLPGIFCKLLRIRKRSTVALAFGILPGIVLYLTGGGHASQYIGILAGAVGGYFLSCSPMLPATVTTSEDHSGGERIEQVAQVLEAMGKDLPIEKMPCRREAEQVFDAAAEQICRKCAFFHRCWQNRARETYDILSAAAPGIIEKGIAREQDFPKSFRTQCCSMDRLIYAINRELEGMLYRRRYHMHLWENRKLLEQEYNLLAQYLRSPEKAERGERRFTPRASICSVGKAREKACGDRGVCFFGGDGHYYVILCDGMGTGEEAARLSSHAIRLLENLLRGGMGPEEALRLMNGNMLLRGNGTFSTVDLLRLDLYSGMAYLYKWGAAPSYWRDGERIQAVGNATPPPGIDIAHLSVPEKCKLSMKSGQLLVMISDGAYGEETEATIAAYRGSSTKELAALLISTMEREDDMTAIVISLDPRVA